MRVVIRADATIRVEGNYDASCSVRFVLREHGFDADKALVVLNGLYFSSGRADTRLGDLRASSDELPVMVHVFVDQNPFKNGDVAEERDHAEAQKIFKLLQNMHCPFAMEYDPGDGKEKWTFHRRG